MSNINKHNYEAYLLDFMEGTLGAEDAKALESFLIDNPQLDTDIFDLSGLTLNPDTQLNFNNKNTLKRDEEMPEFNQREKLLIGLAENDLNEDEKQHAENLLSSDASAIEDYELYRKSKLNPDKNITCPRKSALKKKAPLISLKQLQYIAAAAVITGLLVVGMLQLNLHQTNHPVNSQRIAQDNLIMFDAEKTAHPETDISQLNANASMQTAQVAHHNLPVAVRNTNAAQNSEQRASEIKIEYLPRLTAAVIPAKEDNYPTMPMQERDIPELSPAFPAGDVTYVDNQNNNKTSLTMPDRGQVQAQFDKIKPIEKLRDAKNELIAGNVRSLFK
ncbi:MAG: hypothetical protein PF590_04625 [Candidatus Delongbacteria bacterium]|jgi:hypothetical protein|nr:hypothetical protein [Candidatus Delongbacteria bacterium]